MVKYWLKKGGLYQSIYVDVNMLFFKSKTRSQTGAYSSGFIINQLWNVNLVIFIQN